MKTIYNRIKSIFNAAKNKKEQIKCNYPNNYYGDQHCQPKL